MITYHTQNKLQKFIGNVITPKYSKIEFHKVGIPTYAPKIKRWKMVVFLGVVVPSIPVPGITPALASYLGRWMLK